MPTQQGGPVRSLWGLTWRLLTLGALALWTVAALAYGIFLAELSEPDTEETCRIRQHFFDPEVWHQNERDSWWWQFSSACNAEYSLVPDWWVLAVLLPVLISAWIGRTLLRGGPAPDAVTRYDT